MTKKKKKVHNTPNDRPSSAPGDGSQAIVDYKEKLGLPNWKDLSAELGELAVRQDKSWAAELEAKIALYQKYVEYQVVLASSYKAVGLHNLNAMHNYVDLQQKIFELENKLALEKKNPLESAEWMKAREMLAKEMQFIHKHGLDTARFQKDLEKEKIKFKDDSMFVVESE